MPRLESLRDVFGNLPLAALHTPQLLHTPQKAIGPVLTLAARCSRQTLRKISRTAANEAAQYFAAGIFGRRRCVCGCGTGIRSPCFAVLRGCIGTCSTRAGPGGCRLYPAHQE